MSSRQPRGGVAAAQPGAAGPPSGGPRQNEYFVPRDGIDREVITSDICRYLGNDALVRPGHYENPQTGQSVQGYYITAYRNLTSAMIEDLKADSARWELERRQQSARSTSGVQYRYSETHSQRQQYGPSPSDPGYQPDPSVRDDYNNRYSGAQVPQGYSGQPTGYTTSANPQGGYPSGSGGYSAGHYANPGTSYSPPPDPRYGTVPGSHLPQGYQNLDPYVATGANLPPAGNTPMFSSGAGQTTARIPPSSGGPQSHNYATAGPGQTQQHLPPGMGFPYSAGSSAGGYPMPQVHPQDPLHGRASSGNTQPHLGFASAAGQQQYDDPPRTSAPSPSAQMATSGSSHTRRSERDSSERHHSERHQRASRR